MEESAHFDIPALKTLRTWVEVDLGAVQQNCRLAQEWTHQKEPAVVAVVKANGYGLGLEPVAGALQGLVRGFGVANLAEALALRHAGIRDRIYLLSPALPAEWSAISGAEVVVPVSTLAEVHGIAAASAPVRTLRNPQPVYVVVDTGMGRIGALPEAVAEVAGAVRGRPELILESVASHFPSADEDEGFSRSQNMEFLKVLEGVANPDFPLPAHHLANSAGLLRTLGQGGWVRAGLMLYGVSPIPEAQPLLQPVMAWKTRISLIRTLPAGHGVSYGRSYITTAPTRIATLAVGYADGYPRQASGKGAFVLIEGMECPVLGRITMDQMMVDVTGLGEKAQAGGEVLLAGGGPGNSLSPHRVAAWGDTIAWDLLTGLGPRVQRLYRTPSR